MPADPARIAMMTSDGVVLSRTDVAVRAANPNAVDEGNAEREYFFDDEGDTAVLVDEYWNWRKTFGRIHDFAEVESAIGFGTTIPVAPAIPYMIVVDDTRAINVLAKVRGFAADYVAERHSVELLG